MPHHHHHVERHPENATERVHLGEYNVRTEIEIDAPASSVWNTLTDFDHYEWSSWTPGAPFKGLSGPVEPGAQVVATFHLGGHTVTIDHELIEVEPGVQWAWSAPFAMGMIDHHIYRVEPIDEQRSRFIQTDHAGDGAAVMAGHMTAHSMRHMYERFNAELKAEAERRLAP